MSLALRCPETTIVLAYNSELARRTLTLCREGATLARDAARVLTELAALGKPLPAITVGVIDGADTIITGAVGLVRDSVRIDADADDDPPVRDYRRSLALVEAAEAARSDLAPRLRRDAHRELTLDDLDVVHIVVATSARVEAGTERFDAAHEAYEAALPTNTEVDPADEAQAHIDRTNAQTKAGLSAAGNDVVAGAMAILRDYVLVGAATRAKPSTDHWSGAQDVDELAKRRPPPADLDDTPPSIDLADAARNEPGHVKTGDRVQHVDTDTERGETSE